MVRQVNIHEAKTHFSELIAAVERGEEIVIARRGKPVARIEPAHASAVAPARVLGRWAGKIRVDPSFFETTTEAELAETYRELEALKDVSVAQGKRAG